MNNVIRVPINDISEFAAVCKALLTEGVLFTAQLSGSYWEIECRIDN